MFQEYWKIDICGWWGGSTGNSSCWRIIQARWHQVELQNPRKDGSWEATPNQQSWPSTYAVACEHTSHTHLHSLPLSPAPAKPWHNVIKQPTSSPKQAFLMPPHNFFSKLPPPPRVSHRESCCLFRLVNHWYKIWKQMERCKTLICLMPSYLYSLTFFAERQKTSFIWWSAVPPAASFLQGQVFSGTNQGSKIREELF